MPHHANSRSIADLINRISAARECDAVIVTGSFAKRKATAASDLDLIILVDRRIPPFLVSRYVGNRLADIIVSPASVLARLASRKPPEVDSFESWLVGWLRSGEVLFDRRGLAAKVQAKLKRRRNQRAVQVAPGVVHREWFAFNNNLRHNTILTRSTDPVYSTALRVRLLYSTMEALLGYFRFRGMAWPGEKEAVRYLARHDRPMLKTLERALRGFRPPLAFRTYASLVKRSSTRRWPVWTAKTTQVQLLDTSAPTPSRLNLCRRVWKCLIH